MFMCDTKDLCTYLSDELNSIASDTMRMIFLFLYCYNTYDIMRDY